MYIFIYPGAGRECSVWRSDFIFEFYYPWCYPWLIFAIFDRKNANRDAFDPVVCEVTPPLSIDPLRDDALELHDRCPVVLSSRLRRAASRCSSISRSSRAGRSWK